MDKTKLHICKIGAMHKSATIDMSTSWAALLQCLIDSVAGLSKLSAIACYGMTVFQMLAASRYHTLPSSATA